MKIKTTLIAICICTPLLLFFAIYMLTLSGADETQSPTVFPEPPDELVTENRTDFIGRKITIQNDGSSLEINDPRQLNSASQLGAGQYSITDLDSYATASFSVIFNESNNSFAIALLEAPFAASRLEAESFLMGALGVSAAELCQLESYVGVPADVSAEYVGQDLGFSECFDNVTLE